MYKVSRDFGNGKRQTIVSCMGHIRRTQEELKAPVLILARVPDDPDMLTCMGCFKGWDK